MKNSKKKLERIRNKHIKALIIFLNELRTAEEIENNKSFRFLAKTLRCSDESIKKAVTQFNWISCRALPEPAVRSWMSDRGLPRKSY